MKLTQSERGQLLTILNSENENRVRLMAEAVANGERVDSIDAERTLRFDESEPLELLDHVDGNAWAIQTINGQRAGMEDAALIMQNAPALQGLSLSAQDRVIAGQRNAKIAAENAQTGVDPDFLAGQVVLDSHKDTVSAEQTYSSAVAWFAAGAGAARNHAEDLCLRLQIIDEMNIGATHPKMQAELETCKLAAQHVFNVLAALSSDNAQPMAASFSIDTGAGNVG